MIQRFDSPSGNLPVLWVKDDRYSIRQGDFTPEELRQIAEEIDAMNPPTGWVFKRLRRKNGFTWSSCIVRGDEVITFGLGEDEYAVLMAHDLNSGRANENSFIKSNRSEYEAKEVL